MREVALLSRNKTAGASRGAADRIQRYWAFLSYSHKDSEVADWLHASLEKYRIPRSLVGRETSGGIVPASFSPIFRDRHELAASGDLGHTIREALAASRCLIVLCSPEAAASRWTNEEILAFKKLNPHGCVLAAITGGEPFASEMRGREAEECFPPALRQKFDSRGRATGKRAEPIAADLRDHGDGRQLGLLKIVAGMLGIGLDELVQRDQQRRHKRLTYIAAASLAGMVMTSGLAVFAFDKRDEARDQRREAEGLVGFMLGDLKDKLEPIGKLEALDSVGARALDYFEKQDKSELSDAALAQRSKALTLIGQIAQTRGDLDGALARYREAMASTAELARRKPNDAQGLFDHAQNVFWVGDIARERGKMDQAEQSMREYERLADRMIAIDPGKREWQMEVQYATANLGIVLYGRRRFAAASKQFQRALNTIETVAAAEPANRQYQQAMSESLAWLADAMRSEGRLDEAIAQRERQVELLGELSRRGQGDVEYRQRFIPASQALGRLFAAKGQLVPALRYLRASVAEADSLLPTEPENTRWMDYAAGAKLSLAETLLAARQGDAAATQARSGCDFANRLFARDPSVVGWRRLRRSCLTLRTRLALASGATDEALYLAQSALTAARSENSRDPVTDRYTIAGAFRLLGDVRRQAGDVQPARLAWVNGLSVLPPNGIEQPNEMSERAALLMRLGRGAEAKPLNDRLAAIGYRQAN